MATLIQFKRGYKETWEQQNPVLAIGEPAIEKDTLRFKIGDGITPWNELRYQGETESFIKIGYYLNNKFYTDSTYTVELVKSVDYLYIDANSDSNLYTYNGQSFVPAVKEASEDVKGVMKLYQNAGDNTDGAMSQKTVTDGVKSIAFALDPEEEDCLIIDVPWDDVQGRYPTE